MIFKMACLPLDSGVINKLTGLRGFFFFFFFFFHCRKVLMTDTQTSLSSLSSFRDWFTLLVHLVLSLNGKISYFQLSIFALLLLTVLKSVLPLSLWMDKDSVNEQFHSVLVESECSFSIKFIMLIWFCCEQCIAEGERETIYKLEPNKINLHFIQSFKIL